MAELRQGAAELRRATGREVIMSDVGNFRIDLEVENPARPGERRRVEHVLVDHRRGGFESPRRPGEPAARRCRPGARRGGRLTLASSSRGNVANYRCLRACARRRPCRRGPQGLRWATRSSRRGSARAVASPLRIQRRATPRRDLVSPHAIRIEGAPPKPPIVVPADRRTRDASRSHALPLDPVPGRSAQGMPHCDGHHTNG